MLQSITTTLCLTALLLIPPRIVADMAEVDAVFEAFDNTRSPGCALGVMRDGAFVYRRGYGMANLEHGIPLTSDSVFRIASTSKQFTAMAVALLAEEGKLSLEDAIRKHFPELPDWADKATVRQLILHTSGIRDYLALAWLAGVTSDAAHFTDQWVFDLLARQRETNFPPGSQYLYSNSGYLLLAHLVQRISGQSLKAFTTERIFDPLGMTDTHFHDDHTHIVPRRAAGYAPADDGYHISMTTLDLVGDGGVYTTIDDLLAWDSNFTDNRLGRGGPELIDLMTTPGTLNDGSTMDYAFGLSVEHYRGLDTIGHGGAFVGFRSQMTRFPEQRLTIAILCNRADGAPWDKARAVANILLADQLEPVQDTAAEDAGSGSPDEADLQRYVGDFWEPAEGFAAETAVIDGKLWAVHSPERKNELAPAGENRFRMLGVGADVLVEFDMDGERVTAMRRFINDRPRGEFTPFTRRQVTAQELEVYAGLFFSPELDVEYRLEVENGSLMLTLAEEPARELTALFGETFENPEWGSFEFERDASGSVSGFRLQSGRVRNLVFERSPIPDP